MNWEDQLHLLYEFHYQGHGGMQALAAHIGVTRGSVLNWMNKKINPLTGRVIEPNFENRGAIAALYLRKVGED